jgi:hypothetical protein
VRKQQAEERYWPFFIKDLCDLFQARYCVSNLTEPKPVDLLYPEKL